jgi:hypothetical protein
MAKRENKSVVAVDQIPNEVIGAVVSADLAQIEADAKSHPNKDAQRRILFCVDRLRQIATAEISPELSMKMEEIKEVLNS